MKGRKTEKACIFFMKGLKTKKTCIFFIKSAENFEVDVKERKYDALDVLVD